MKYFSKLKGEMIEMMHPCYPNLPLSLKTKLLYSTVHLVTFPKFFIVPLEELDICSHQ